jgi:LmbE family N-acetylglucosaminyl deacetylase
MLPTSTATLIVSPHLDDAVFSCRDLLALHKEVDVVTVFTGTAPQPAPCTQWDARCGFADASSAMQARLAEDARALGALSAHPLRLDFLDRQYGASPTPAHVAAALQALQQAHGYGAIMMPLGLCHPDHELVHTACLTVLQHHPQLLWLAYEEAPYRRLPGLVQQRLAVLASAGVMASPSVLSPAAVTAELPALLALALGAYASQLPAFDPAERADIDLPGRYWRLSLQAAEP